MLDAAEQAQAYSDPVSLKLWQIIAIADGEATPPGGELDIPQRKITEHYSVQILPPAVLEFKATANVTWRIEPR
jgi:hypothetical protein